MNSPKSATTAGLLGILLGAFGAHEWYLGDTKKAKKHVILAVVGILLLTASTILNTVIGSIDQAALVAAIHYATPILKVIAWLLIFGDLIWGLIEGVIILAGGDAGLAERGYFVASAAQAQPVLTQNTVLPPVAAPATSATPATPINSPVAPPAAATSPSPAAFSPAPAQPPVVSAPMPVATNNSIAFHSSNIPAANTNNLFQQPPALAPDGTPLLADTPTPPTRAPLSNAAKRWILIGGIILAVGLATLIIINIILGGVNTVTSSGYRETYLAAKMLVEPFAGLDRSSSCQKAVEYVDSKFVERAAYDGYIKSCQSLALNVGALVDQLGETTAIAWEPTLAEQYSEFQELYHLAFPEDNHLADSLNLYQIWHNFILDSSYLTTDSADIDFYKAAEPLRKSGNATLTQYGEDWLQRQLDYVHSYKVYWDTSYLDPNKETLRLELEAKQTALQQWISEHQPNLPKLVPLTIPDITPVINSFDNLYNSIRQAYETHYDHSSGDCNVSGRTVYCS